MVRLHFSNFRIITTIFWGVLIFGMLYFQEQVRRWQEYEEKMEMEERNRPKPKHRPAGWFLYHTLALYFFFF